MYPRVNYEMTEEDLKELLSQMRPTPVMFLSGGIPFGGNQQDNANRAWEKLGKKMGFDYMTVQPDRKGDRFFTAVPSESDEQRKRRESDEKIARLKQNISELEKDIAERQAKLDSLLRTI